MPDIEFIETAEEIPVENEKPLFTQIKADEGVCGARVRKQAQRAKDAVRVKGDFKVSVEG